MTEGKCVLYVKEYHSKYDSESDKEKTLFLQKVQTEGCEFKERPNNVTEVERACKSITSIANANNMRFSPIQDTLRSKTNQSSLQMFSNSYCTRELCNTGNGRKLFITLLINL